MFWLKIFFVVFTLEVLDCDVTNMKIIKTSTHQGGGIRLKAQNIQKLRIRLVYGKYFNKMNYSKEIKMYGIRPAVAFISRALKAKIPLLKPLIIDRFCVKEYNYLKIDGENVCPENCTTTISDVKINEKYLSKCRYLSSNKTVITYGKDGTGAKNTDIIIFITGYKCRNGSLAQSRLVALDQDTERPVAGIIRICENVQTQFDSDSKKELTKNIILHEIIHILGFSTQLYAYFYDHLGKPRTPRMLNNNPNNGKMSLDGFEMFKPSPNTFVEIEKEISSPNGVKMKKVGMLTTPSVVREARKHFGCNSLKGVILEDYGPRSNAYSHFESNYFQGELMMIHDKPKTFVSRFTLALFEDSGWYDVDYKLAENFLFGKNLGCDFINKSCYKYIMDKKARKESIYPYCEQPDTYRCSADHDRVERCNLRRSSNNNIPEDRKYFQDKFLVSFDDSMDNCPMFTGISLYSKLNAKCQEVREEDPEVTRDKIIWTHSKDAKCFNSPDTSEWLWSSDFFTVINPIQGAGCYQYKCSLKNKLELIIKNVTHTCQFDGQVMNINAVLNKLLNIEGKIICPKFKEICQQKRQCKSTSPYVLGFCGKEEDEKIIIFNFEEKIKISIFMNSLGIVFSFIYVVFLHV